MEQRRCTGRRPPRCSSWFLKTAFKITHNSSNIRVRCCTKWSCLKKKLTAPRPSEHPPFREENVKTFRWNHWLQIPNLFMAFKRVPPTLRALHGVLHGAPWRLMEVHGDSWSSMEPPWTSVELHEPPWSFMSLHGGSWTSMEAHGAPWRSPRRLMEVSMEVRGGSMEVHGAPCRSPWRSVEAPWRSVEVSTEVHGAPWRSPWRSPQRLIHGGLHGVPDNVGRRPPLYCTLTLIAMQGYQAKSKNKTEKCSASLNMVVIVVMCVAVRRALFEFGTLRSKMPWRVECPKSEKIV